MRAVSEEFVTRFVPLTRSKVELVDDRRLGGCPIVFDTLSQDLGGWYERIQSAAVDRTLREGTNVDCLLDHKRETTSIIGSTESGLMRQKKERYGLVVDVRPPDTTVVRDLIANIKAGLVKGMSFRFRPMPDGVRWDEEDGKIIRTITDMKYSEFSYVVNPAYLETSAHVRSLELDRLALEEYRSGHGGWKPSLALRDRIARAGTR